jgi:hypothetical protein
MEENNEDLIFSMTAYYEVPFCNLISPLTLGLLVKENHS